MAIVFLVMCFLIGYFISFLIEKPKTETTLNETLIYAPRIPYIPRIQVLGSLTGKIIFCESGNNPNAYNPKSGATGLLQVIPSSERFCEKGLGRKLDMRNPEDNIACGEYLYKHGGICNHWKESSSCWDINNICLKEEIN